MELDKIKKMRDKLEQTLTTITWNFEQDTGVKIASQVWLSRYNKPDTQAGYIRKAVVKLEIESDD